MWFLPDVGHHCREGSLLGALGIVALTVDVMHKFELCIWKAVLKHLIQILYTQGVEVVAEFDHQ